MTAPMPLAQLLYGLVDIGGAPAPVITALSLDSRTVVPGSLFLALAGHNQDGRRFIADAVARGAVFVLSETAPDGTVGTTPVRSCPALRTLVGPIADRFFGQPSAALTVVGVTGTNGKTTTTHLLARALSTRAPCAVIGTLGNGFPDALTPEDRTTPDAVSVHRWLARLAAEGARTVAMEVSSHALDQGRVGGVRFAGALFTNLTRDHLDYHGDMARYQAAKARLFATPGLGFAVFNARDPASAVLRRALSPGVSVWHYGPGGEVQVTAMETVTSGLRLTLATPDGAVTLNSPLLGAFNAENLLGALTVLLAMGWTADAAARALAAAPPVPGRMERFTLGAGRPLVIVDYAHTPDALAQVLAAARGHSRGRVVCVFGCGGDRDQGKRPLMGECASRLADHVIITHDNPRHEDPDAIVADILRGVAAARRAIVEVVAERSAAIDRAVRMAGSADVVVVAGKGHEEYQQVGDRRVPYSDRQTVRRLAGAA